VTNVPHRSLTHLYPGVADLPNVCL